MNFSKHASLIIAQMFNFLNLGFEGYKKIVYKGLRNPSLFIKSLGTDILYCTLIFTHKPLFYIFKNSSLAICIVQSKLLN
jgi:glutamate decarboxylase